MKVELIEEGSSDAPLIRIYGDEPESIAKLISLIDSLEGSIELTADSKFPPINNCRLVFILSNISKGLVQTSTNNFELALNHEDWSHIKELITPLANPDSQGYQWLDETNKVALLVSRYSNGAW